MSLVIVRVEHEWKPPIRNRWGEKEANCAWLYRHLCLTSGRMTRSVSEETETTVEPMTREQQLTPPQTPTTAMRQSHDSCSFFGRRRRHRSHYPHRQQHRQSSRSRRMEVSSPNNGESLLLFLLSCLVRYIGVRSTSDHHRWNSTTDSQQYGHDTPRTTNTAARTSNENQTSIDQRTKLSTEAIQSKHHCSIWSSLAPDCVRQVCSSPAS